MPDPAAPSPRLAKLQAMLAADPADPFIFYALAQEHAKAGDHAAAITFFDRTLAADPAYLYAYFHKARSQQAMTNIPAALATTAAGLAAAQKAMDSKALNELSSLQMELEML